MVVVLGKERRVISYPLFLWLGSLYTILQAWEPTVPTLGYILPSLSHITSINSFWVSIQVSYHIGGFLLGSRLDCDQQTPGLGLSCVLL